MAAPAILVIGTAGQLATCFGLHQQLELVAHV